MFIRVGLCFVFPFDTLPIFVSNFKVNRGAREYYLWVCFVSMNPQVYSLVLHPRIVLENQEL